MSESWIVRDFQLLTVNIPHHAFVSGQLIGQAIVTVATAKNEFRETRIFQPWHKNTLHLGLTARRDSEEELESLLPWFSNFQYDGRVEWGLEESDTPILGPFKEKLVTVQSLTERELLLADVAIGFGVLTPTDVFNKTRTENGML